MRKKNENKKGVGKPALYTNPMKRVNVMLDPETIKYYTAQGCGNLSKGIRESARGLTSRALDGATYCPALVHFFVEGSCARCGFPEPPRQ